jgi:autotransporter-associated beta strand protein
LALPAVQINNAASLAMTGDQAFGTLAGAGNLGLNSFTLSTGSGGDSTFAGVISGSGSLFKQGATSVFTLSGSNTYTGPTRVQAGTLRVGDGATAGSLLTTSNFVVDGTLSMARSDNVALAQAVSGSGSVEQAGDGRLLYSGNNKTYAGATTVTRGELATSTAEELPDGSAVTVAATGRLTLGGNETLRSLAGAGAVSLGGNLTASENLSLGGAVSSAGAITLTGQRIDAVNTGNRFGGAVSLDARDRATLASGVENGNARDLVLDTVTVAAGGRIDAGLLNLAGATKVNGGTLELASSAARTAIAPDADIAGKQALPALPLAYAGDAVVQGANSRITVAAGAGLSVTVPNGASVQLLQADNSFVGGLSVVSGEANKAWDTNTASLTFGSSPATNYAVQNRVRINGTTVNIGGEGIVADIVALRADRLATIGTTAAIVARMPFDSNAGTASSVPALTLELTPASYDISFPFGLAGADSGVRVNVGSQAYGNRVLALDAGYVTVLPRNGAKGATAVLLTGPVVNAAGGYRFFFDGARSQTQIPVIYNGNPPTTPQVENSISATVSVSEGARKQRFDEAVRTENVAIRLRAGVIAEVGPAPSATLGAEGLRVPASCTPASNTLLCTPTP